MTIQTIDTANDTVLTIDANAPDARSKMLASASAIAALVIDSEGKLAETAKSWGHNLFRAVYVDNANMDTMIGDSKVAAGWSVLTTNETGKKAKARLEVYFSNARKVAEAWGGMEQAARDDVLAGLSSIHYLAGQLRKAESDAKKAADKAVKLAKAEQEAADAKAVVDAGPTGDDIVPVDAVDAITALTVAMSDMSDADFASIAADMAALIAAYDARINAGADQAIAA
jgi:hypothetical protein